MTLPVVRPTHCSASCDFRRGVTPGGGSVAPSPRPTAVAELAGESSYFLVPLGGHAIPPHDATFW